MCAHAVLTDRIMNKLITISSLPMLLLFLLSLILLSLSFTTCPSAAAAPLKSFFSLHNYIPVDSEQGLDVAAALDHVDHSGLGEKEGDDDLSNVSLPAVFFISSPPDLIGVEQCDENGDDAEECLKRRMMSEAHLDYIYTQQHKP